MADKITLADNSTATLERKKEAVTEIQGPAKDQESLPELPDINSLFELGMSPLSVAQSLIGQLPVPNFLPSVNPGSFAEIASSISTSGTFEPAQIFAQAQQLKQLICNFTPPNVTIPDFEKLFDVNVENIEDYFLNAFKGFSDIDPGKIAENLGKQVYEALKSQFNQFTDLFTKCQKDEENS